MTIISQSFKLAADGVYGKTAQDSSGSGAAKMDQAFAALLGDDPEEMLKKITKNGASSYWSWQMEELKKKVAAQVMQEMNLTPEQIANMPAKQRAEVEDKIMKEVQRRIEQIMEEGMRKKQTDFYVSGMDEKAPSTQTATQMIGSTLDISA